MDGGVNKLDEFVGPQARKQNPEHRVAVRCGDIKIGEGTFTVMAGPCAIESVDQAVETAKVVEEAGAKIFRASLFKPRTSPYSFQGIGPEGLPILQAVRTETKLLLETEVLSLKHLELLHDHVDMLRVGARGMRNYELLKEVGQTQKPLILKRGMSATLKDFLLAAEYVLVNGNEKVILCERGIRTFETYTRNTLDILAVPALKELTHLPIIVDPSHSAGRRSLVGPASKAGLAAGADGLLVEVHPNPDGALSDGDQALDLSAFLTLMDELRSLAAVMGKVV
ncbi:MAG: 3-deoxy-7-phosphoheptulonate synthase [Gemmatimonadetes bacterium]|nr:3-deoxy-7-phosphoheptulonate synthase [Gemmatimonadota bacterium]NNM06954.1 3-deoxy-7-phosphoheptulonate synthase [Gemmatimonadota bacterium]